MPAITFSDFSGGLDRRLPINVQEASRLWELRNAYITLGKRIKKRPGLKLEASGLSGSFGLQNVSGRLKVFVTRSTVYTPPAAVDKVELDVPTWSAGTLSAIHYADIFQGFAFVVAQYSDGLMAHHYVDKSPTTVTVSIASPGVVTWTAHGLINGQAVQLSTTGALPTGLTAGTVYYVVNKAADTFELAATLGGASINTSGTQSGVHTATAMTYITDANNPRSMSVTKAASRVFAINGETVRYCAAGSARDWTTASDAGFLPVALQQDTKSGCTAVGTFQDALVVFFAESAQIWDVATDPSANAIRKRIWGVGINDGELTQAGFANDLAFLSPYGVRSMTVAQNTDRIDDTDMGVPVDSLVVADIATSAAQPNRIETFGTWVHELGQYWLVFDAGASSKVWAYSFSRSSKVACWSEYTFFERFTGLATVGGKVYLRTDDKLFSVSADVHTDNGNLIDVEVQMAFQDAKAPSVLKQFYGMDVVFSGGADVSFLYDPRDQTKETISQTLTGDTRPGDIVPIEMCATAAAPIFRHSDDEAFELSAVTLLYNALTTAA